MSYLTCHAPDCHQPAKRKWCSEACRKRTEYGGTCEKCGARTDGSNGPGKAPKQCVVCAGQSQRKWTKEEIIQAMLRWQTNHGHQPSANEWYKATAEHPATMTVFNRFGTWNLAIQAVADAGHAGFCPRKPKRAPKPRSKRPPKATVKDPKLRHGQQPIKPLSQILREVTDEEDDHSTNTPAQNRARVAKAQANAGRSQKGG